MNFERRKTRGGRVILAAGLLLYAQSPATPVFHHVHLRVEDPAAAMGTFVRRHNCVEMIVQGLGVGVRCGASYVLFDRRVDDPSPVPGVRGWVSVSGKGDRARVTVRVATPDPRATAAWLSAEVGPSSAASPLTFVAGDPRRPPPDEITHIGFSALGGPAAASRRSGPGGLEIEMLPDEADGPDAFWCPMHPDVRAAVARPCERCGMTLTPIAAPVFGDYRLRFDYKASSGSAGRLTLRIEDPATGETARRFVPMHERLLHLFVVSRDLSFFDHVHPTPDEAGIFTVDLALPGPGVYALFADAFPALGTPQFLQSTLITPDYHGEVFGDRPPPRAGTGGAQVVDGLRFTLAPVVWRAGQPVRLSIAIRDVAGLPVENLEPYLGAPGHLLVVSDDLSTGIHSHPTDARTLGPTIAFDSTLPGPGTYKLWLQVQRGGRVHTWSEVFVVRQ